MARSAEDCGLILAAIAGHDPRDPSSMPGRFSFHPRALTGHHFRLGILAHDYQKHHAAAVEARFHAALAVFRDFGYDMEEAALPEYPYDRAAGTIVTVEGASAFENLIRGPRLAELEDTGQQAGLLAGLAVPAVDYLRAMRIRTLAAGPAASTFEQFDALIAPTLLQEAPPVDRSLRETWAGGGNGGPGNLLGWPSISIPMGLGPDKLPLGLELIGPPGGEAVLLALAMAFQGATEWHRLQPPL
jgi:aspartyl-tRNA(Asn)/glutamyl-tRNA(Gln) amidotransferase subunit A